jgi:UDP-glucose 4-epimerase
MTVAPLSPYAASKCVNEIYAQVFSKVYGLQTVGLRYFNVFGPRQDPASDYAAVIPKFVTRMLEGKPPLIFGDGKQTRDFVFVENVAKANQLAAVSEISGKVLNIGSGVRYNLLQLISVLNEILGTDYEPAFESARSGEVRHSLADIGSARELIGYGEEIDFRSGLQKTVEWFNF